MAEESKGGPRAQAIARTIFPNTGGTIIGGVGGMVQTGPVQVIEQKPRPRRVLPVDMLAAKLDALMLPSMTARLGEEKVAKMREGQAKLTNAFKAEHAPDDDRAVPATPRATPHPLARTTTTTKRR
jgi:hypothetical protein